MKDATGRATIIIYDPLHYKWLQSTHPEYGEDYYDKVIVMEGSSSQETLLVPSEPSTEVEQSAIQDYSESSVELEIKT